MVLRVFLFELGELRYDVDAEGLHHSGFEVFLLQGDQPSPIEIAILLCQLLGLGLGEAAAHEMAVLFFVVVVFPAA